MDPSPDPAPFAWQPFTPSGVAAFARARLGRLFLVQGLIALAAAGAVVWFLHRCWVPVITDAIHHLPAQGEMRRGNLDWFGDSPVLLAQGRSLALTVDLEHSGQARSPAHVQVEFGRRDARVISLLGFLPLSYPPRGAVAFNRPELEPWWGAWAPPLLALAAGLTVASLLLSWAALATLYCGPVWVMGFFADRGLTLGGSWRLAGAALMPGAVFLTAAVVLYGLGALEVIGLLVAFVLHVPLAWLFACTACWKAPRQVLPAEAARNPFQHQPSPTAEPPADAGQTPPTAR
jgi:hypothetical protein